MGGTYFIHQESIGLGKDDVRYKNAACVLLLKLFKLFLLKTFKNDFK